MNDLIIIGAGPAGITAAIYGARKKMDFMIISRDIGGQTLWTSNIENYTSYKIITGQELVQRFTDHLEHFNVNLKTETVRSVIKKNGIIEVETGKAKYTTKSLIIASGRTHKKLLIEGEDKFLNKGVAYCATCDAPVFADKDVVVAGGGNSALEAVLQLVNIARKVILLNPDSRLYADPVMIEKANKSKNFSLQNNAKVEKILGHHFVEGIEISSQGKTSELAIQGLFIEIGSVPAADYIKDIQKNESHEIIVNCACETSIPGIFGAGDVTSVPAKQIIVAAGEGTKALLSAFKYLNKLK